LVRHVAANRKSLPTSIPGKLRRGLASGSAFEPSIGKIDGDKSTLGIFSEELQAKNAEPAQLFDDRSVRQLNSGK
jgi:hypothetical protein